MKIILTGKNSYIASNVCKMLLSKGHSARCVSVRNGIDALEFKGIDAVIHCAAIVHKKEKKYADKYDAVNCELTAELARKAKSEGVKHFIFLSTMAVYGVKEGEISSATLLSPVTLYGKSKLKAENMLRELEDESFGVSIVRPPMVYGRGCPGNYGRLSRLSRLLPVIPLIYGKKSFIYIENLAHFITDLTEKSNFGTFMPMDGRYTSTSEFMKLISGRAYSKLLGRLVSLIPLAVLKKMFAPLWYSEDVASMCGHVSVEEAVERSEGRK